MQKKVYTEFIQQESNLKMEFKILKVKYKGKEFKIEEDYPEVGAYLFVYANNVCIEDYLQDTIEHCKRFAFEEYGVPLNSW